MQSRPNLDWFMMVPFLWGGFVGEGLFCKKRRLGKPSRVICYANTRPSPTPPPKKLFSKKGLVGIF
jgi:hypothetical protein